jgi:hypothetical protein
MPHPKRSGTTDVPDTTDNPAPRNRERRWAVVTADGGHVWLGRHSDPTDDELTQVSAALQAKALVGRLAVTEGTYYSRQKLDVLMVRPLSGEGDWEAARNAFLSRRKQATASR